MSGSQETTAPAAELVTLANLALFRASAKATLTTLTDGSPEAQACSLFLPLVIGAMLTAYPWRFAQRIGTLTAEASSSNPLWANEFAKPADCLKVLGILNPNLPACAYGHLDDFFEQGLPFDEGFNGTSPVLWANLPWVPPAAAASGAVAALACSYTTNAITPLQWPIPFQQLVSWALAAEIALPLTGNGQVVAQAREGMETALQNAIMTDSPRRFQSTAYVPDWIAVRGTGPEFREHGVSQVLAFYDSGFVQALDAVAASQAAVPSYLTASAGLNGVQLAGIAAAEIGAAQRGQYVPGFTPDGRIGVFAIGDSPVGWRRPYHGEIIPSVIAIGEAIGDLAIGDQVGDVETGEVELP